MHSVYLKLSNSLTQLASWVVILHALPGNWSTGTDAFENLSAPVLMHLRIQRILFSCLSLCCLHLTEAGEGAAWYYSYSDVS